MRDPANAWSWVNFSKHFPPDRLLCVVGTNYRTYTTRVATALNRLFSAPQEDISIFKNLPLEKPQPEALAKVLQFLKFSSSDVFQITEMVGSAIKIATSITSIVGAVGTVLDLAKKLGIFGREEKSVESWLKDVMKRVDEILQKRYEVSAGKARVAKDMVDMEAITEKENERKALEQQALAEFLASQGIQATPAAEGQAAPAVKEIGPQQ